MVLNLERNHYLRQKAIEIHGTSCKVCGFNFEKCMAILERILLRFIILSRCILLEKISVNPETDLIPLCSNCQK